MKVLAVCEKQTMETKHPQVLQFKPQEVIGESSISRGYEQHSIPAVIKVVSVGGGGANALNRMIEDSLGGIEFIAINTDIQDLNNKSKADVKLQIGQKVTGGRGAGGVPDKGEKAALEDADTIADALRGADMVFITAGMGGGTGTGAAPVAARIAKESGALTVAVVTTPFEFEGRYKMRLAEEGIEKLRNEVDTLIVIPNQYLFKIIDNTMTWNNAYLMADKVLCQAVQGISAIITETGYNNVDFADVETVMRGKGDALMGIGYGSGENRAQEAIKNAIDNPLLEDTCIDGATGVLIDIVATHEIPLVEIKKICDSIKEKCHSDVHLIYGFRTDIRFEDAVQITVIATGFPSDKKQEEIPQAAAKPSNCEFIDYPEYERMTRRIKRPEYLNYLPHRGEYEDDLEVPSVIRNYSYQTEEITSVSRG